MIAIPPKFAGRAAVSPEEAAEIAGIDRATFYRHHMPQVRGGKIASFKVGACRRIIVASYLTFLEQEAQHGT
jgi:hypothetical protein